MKEEMLKQKEEELRQQVAADKKKGKRSFRIFLIILIAAFFIGAVAGMITIGLKGGAALLQAYTAQIYNVCAIVVPAIMVVQLMIQNLVVNLEKQLNPEKRGSVFDLRFQEEWINSCDEAEQLIEYRAGFQAYKIGQYVCIGMWVLCVMAQFAFDTGVFPVACVTVIWMVLVCVYLTEHIRLERKSRGLSK